VLTTPDRGANTLCARAKRDPKRSARIQRSFTVVDLIPPSDVPGLTISNITATGAKATWGAATDNYGLAGYAVTVDGGPAHRTTVGTRSYSSSWEKDRLARCTCTPPCHNARASGRPAYTSNPPPAPAISTLRAGPRAVNSGGTANENVAGSTGDAALLITAQ
jgi:hypothetical protein